MFCSERNAKKKVHGGTIADKFGKLGKPKGAAHTEEIRKYVNDAGEFSLLKFLDKDRDELNRLSFSVGAL